ncbi:tetratricopeptide repeat protein [Streptomyces fulvoviolaceus]|uniref:tetratricopeptide repeat protein n=1 Tax=Streptomyces fulvoviolaceus TaxID=285535 RepID=UPI0004C5E2C0|nr:tetratricopeptide repeat protein [Streptomyces fulvoviolaceus]MCT9084213.1 tetratricopeptide repeat protein [Streptomyces fulvoviolaceus]
MSRLSRDKKRDQKNGGPAAPAAPIDVRVPATGPGASVGGVPVAAAPGEELQQAVLRHLHDIARAGGHPVHATIHDERIGYVVPLEVSPDGSSRFTAEPVGIAPPEVPRQAEWPVAAAEEPVRHDPPPHLLRQTPEPVQDAAPTYALRPLPDAPPPGTVLPPTGEFGPPPVMDARPLPVPEPLPLPVAPPTPPPAPVPFAEPVLLMDDPDPKPTPVRGFDAVAEAVLGDGPPAVPGGAAAFLAEPVARINEAVREGRIDVAAELAERTAAQAAQALGPEHPEVLRLYELTAYVAYLGGEPVRALRLSLDLARVQHRARDAEAAYGNVQSAATAWRAVRDPLQGLDLGRELLTLWTELAAGEGPAAEDPDKLEKARARMLRLAERARAAE